ncbi:MAG: protease complex subunit PrcB family protein [Flavobacterium sp.]|nr:MAG: protease complex subunit PrcB family protein [Flavobacterium sp.]
MKQIILFLSILFLITSCDSDDSEVSEVQFTVIAQGDVYNGNFETPKLNLVIKNNEQWNALKNSMSSYSVTKINETDIDFTKYEVIAVVDQVYRSGGYSIDITKISQNNRNIIVKVDQLQKGNLTSVITQPFHIVKITKTGKRIIFK